jgi:hypothetical protein
MTDRVVSTKLSEEIHTKLLDACNGKGCSPSSFIKDAIMNKIGNQEIPQFQDDQMTISELKKFLGLEKDKKVVGIVSSKPKYIGVRKT